MVFGQELKIEAKGFSDIIDITFKVQNIVTESGIKDGIVNIHSIGSTASISTIEYESALVADMEEQLEKFVSKNMKSRHSETWGDDNGFSHIRATFMGPGMTVPVSNGKVLLGTWQQIVVFNHDNRERSRRIFVQIIGE